MPYTFLVSSPKKYFFLLVLFKPLSRVCFVFPIFPSAFGKFFCRVVSMYLFYCLVLLVYFVKVVFSDFY